MNARTVILACLLCLALAGCAKPKGAVLLLPDPDGHVGTVTVTNTQGAQTLSQSGAAVRVANAKAAPEAPAPLSAEERDKLFGAALRALPEQPVRFLLYFISDGVQLTPESQALVPKMLSAASQRKTRDIAVVGHASRQGDPKFNLDLSRRRADYVASLLTKGGMNRQDMEISSHGSNNPLVQSSNSNEPKNRRVEVTIR